MNAGIQIFNDQQVLQIDSDFRNARYAFGGYANTKAVGSTSYSVNVPLDSTTSSALECPMVLIRPEQTEQWVGGCFVNSPYEAFGSIPARPNGGVQLWGQCPFEWAILSTRIGLSGGGSTFGFDVFDANGQLVFASAYRQLRITELFDDPDSNGWPRTFNLTKGQNNPWIWANPMIGIVGGPYDDQMPGIVAKFNGSRTQMTVRALDVLTMTPVTSLPSNPFANYRRFFGTATY